jgi:signal transduction histidine kinase
MEYLSFVRTIDDWEWKIGTGKHLGLIEDEIARREAALWQRTWVNMLSGGPVWRRGIRGDSVGNDPE